MTSFLQMIIRMDRPFAKDLPHGPVHSDYVYRWSLFVSHCLSLFVVGRCLSLVVVCRWWLFVVGRCLSLFVVCRWWAVVWCSYCSSVVEYCGVEYYMVGSSVV